MHNGVRYVRKGLNDHNIRARDDAPQRWQVQQGGIRAFRRCITKSTGTWNFGQFTPGEADESPSDAKADGADDGPAESKSRATINIRQVEGQCKILCD